MIDAWAPIHPGPVPAHTTPLIGGLGCHIGFVPSACNFRERRCVLTKYPETSNRCPITRGSDPRSTFADGTDVIDQELVPFEMWIGSKVEVGCLFG